MSLESKNKATAKLQSALTGNHFKNLLIIPKNKQKKLMFHKDTAKLYVRVFKSKITPHLNIAEIKLKKFLT